MLPANITAWSLLVRVREKLEQGGGLDPWLDGEDHDPTDKKVITFLPSAALSQVISVKMAVL